MSASGIGENEAGRVALRRLPRALARALTPLTPLLRSYLLFEGFTLIDPDEMRRRRWRWPTWRRVLRPVGATLWWLGVLLSWAIPESTFRGSSALAYGLVVGLVVCVVLGIGLEWCDRRREGRHIIGRGRGH